MTVSNEPSDEAIEFAIKELKNSVEFDMKRIEQLEKALYERKIVKNKLEFDIPDMPEDKGPFTFVMRMLQQIKNKYGYGYSLQYSNTERKLVRLLQLDENYADEQIQEIKHAVEWAISKHKEYTERKGN